MTDPNTEPLMLTRQEAARLARVSLSTLDEALRQKKLPCSRIGKRVLIPRKAFMRILQGADNESASHFL